MSENFKPISNNKHTDTFECACCGKIIPISQKKFLGNDIVCNKCFWTIRRVEHW